MAKQVAGDYEKWTQAEYARANAAYEADPLGLKWMYDSVEKRIAAIRSMIAETEMTVEERISLGIEGDWLPSWPILLRTELQRLEDGSV